MSNYGKLYIVSTPIGNLEDITLRALRILKEVDIIVCEDTRRTQILLNHYNIKKPLLSYYSYNEIKRIKTIFNILQEGKNIALVSDSGTPGISDPGAVLIKKAIESGYTVESIPGPSAFVSALVCSGLATNGFVFLGFLPRKENKIKKIISESMKLGKTIIFYESPYRIKKTVELCRNIFGNNAQCVIAREITKKFEEYIRGKLDEIYQMISQNNIKGELVVMIEPSRDKALKEENYGQK